MARINSQTSPRRTFHKSIVTFCFRSANLFSIETMIGTVSGLHKFFIMIFLFLWMKKEFFFDFYGFAKHFSQLWIFIKPKIFWKTKNILKNKNKMCLFPSNDFLSSLNWWRRKMIQIHANNGAPDVRSVLHINIHGIISIGAYEQRWNLLKQLHIHRSMFV